MESSQDRVFYTIPSNDTQDSKNTSTPTSKDTLVNYVKNNIIGNDEVFTSPFGLRKVLYLDYTASGRSLKFIEDYIQSEVLPEYGNTHTTTTITSLQTTLYRHEARDIVRNACNASEHDSVIFVGSGCTGAVHKLICSLNLKQPAIIFIGPYEHHSTFLPWLELGCQVVRIKESQNGQVDNDHLTEMLKKYGTTDRQLIGCFTAVSNITGIISDIDNITIMLHRHSALAFWDYATAAPYLQIDMNPVRNGDDQQYVYKDAVFISTHKFLGGVSTPGILIAKKSLFRRNRPDVCGGGTVFYVRRESHRYLQEPELREEGGTPAIVESIRAGMVFQLKQSITWQHIMDKEHSLLRKAASRWNKCPNLILLGNKSAPKLPIFSFLIYNPNSGRFLHHNFVSAILNDVFGIQSRGGCACAGPYAMDVLGLNEENAKKIENLLIEDKRLDRNHLRRYREYSHREILRPGFTRLNLPFFMSKEELEFVLEAVAMVADNGWKLLPQYIFNPETGEWKQKDFQNYKDRKWLGHINYNKGYMDYKIPTPNIKGPLPETFTDCLSMAEAVFNKAEKMKISLSDQQLLFDDESKPFRWFVLPSEAQQILQGSTLEPLPLSLLPFFPPGFSPGTVHPGDVPPSKMLVSESTVNVQPQTPFSEGMIHSLYSGFQVSEENSYGKVEIQNSTQDVSSNDVLNLDNAQMKAQATASPSRVCDSNQSSCGIVTESSEICDKICDTDIELSTRSSGSKESCLTTCNLKDSCVLDNSGQTCAFKLDSDKRHKDEVLNSDHNNENDGNSNNVNLIVNNNLVVDANNKNDDSTSGMKELDDLRLTEESKPSKTTKWFTPPTFVFRQTVTAIEEYSMIQDGDRVLVCLSGGKDSLSLLHTIRQYQFYCKAKGIKFEFGAVTVDPQTLAYDPSPLISYLASLGVPYFYESQGILEAASNLPYECASICSFCSRMKRGRIYACARREGYNVLALGQHIDDLSESFLMSFFHNGRLRTMKASYTVKQGDLRVIRPFVYVREKQLRTFAEKSKLPIIAENCPACFEAPKERHRTKQLLAAQELLFPQLYSSMSAAMKPLMAINNTNTTITSLVQDSLIDED